MVGQNWQARSKASFNLCINSRSKVLLNVSLSSSRVTWLPVINARSLWYHKSRKNPLLQIKLSWRSLSCHLPGHLCHQKPLHTHTYAHTHARTHNTLTHTQWERCQVSCVYRTEETIWCLRSLTWPSSRGHTYVHKLTNTHKHTK